MQESITSAKRRIMIYHDSGYPGGGAETVTSMLASYISKVGYEVFVVTSQVREDILTDEDRKNISGFVVRPPHLTHKQYSEWFAEVCREKSIDVFLFMVNLYGDIERLRELAPDTKFIYCCHSVPLWQVTCLIASKELWVAKKFRRQFLWRLWFKPILCGLGFVRARIVRQYDKMVRGTDATMVLCDGYREKMKQISKGCDEKCFAIPNAVFDRVQQGSVESKKRQLLFVGRLSNIDKRIDRLLRIWAMLQDEFADWSLVIVGDGPDAEYLRGMERDLGLERVDWQGWKKDPVAHYAAAAITCLTSEFEGWPMALCEAMQQGSVPVAFGATDGICELIGDSGAVVKPYDEQQYAERLRELMRDDSLRVTLAAKALERTKEFTLEKMGQKYVAMFDYVLQGK